MERPTKAAGARAMTTADAQTLRPQRPLSDALREANRVRSAPINHSDLQAFRQNMVLRLRQAGCHDEGVLAAMNAVPRHLFVDSALAAQAYEDTSLPIGLGQTISKPSVVARMIELLRQRPGGLAMERVLEIGTGCGYQAAVLAHVAGRTISIERLRGLHDRAQRQLAALQLSGITLVYGDGRLGHAPAAPYDGIIAAAGGRDLPGAWLEQLARGGRLVAPVQDPALGTQVLMVIDKLADGSIVQRIHEAVRFVPLESGIGDG
jgi:protein-L-isoaspartate(D-aspartate) O-methyltransferase